MTYRHCMIIGLGIVLFTLSGRAYAQLAGSIRGLVTDKDFNDEPLGGVTITVVQTDQSAVSDGQGTYLINDVAPGTYTLIFSKDGFTQEIKADVRVSAGELSEVGASMGGEFTEMDDFIVQELKFDAGSDIGQLEIRNSVPDFRSSIGEEQLAVSGVGNAADALGLVAGATVTDDKAVIRGLPDRYVNSQINSVRFPSADAETRSLELDQFPTDVIESIQVSKTFTPDQQGDASGGAVNIVLKGIPDEDIIKFGVGTSYNTNVTGNDDFLTYPGGGVNTLGIDKGRRDLPTKNPSPVALGTTRSDAPYNYNANMTLAKRHEFVESGWTVGGLVSTFYDHGASFYDDGVDAEYAAYRVDPDGFGARPEQIFFLPDVGGFSALQSPEDRESNVFDITRGSEEVQWGGLGTLGAENEFNKIDLIFLQTRTTRDTAILAEDTRSRGIVTAAIDDLGLSPIDKIFGGVVDPATAGSDLAFIRNQTLQYQERLVRSLQFKGAHTLDFIEPIELDWITL